MSVTEVRVITYIVSNTYVHIKLNSTPITKKHCSNTIMSTVKKRLKTTSDTIDISDFVEIVK